MENQENTIIEKLAQNPKFRQLFDAILQPNIGNIASNINKQMEWLKSLTPEKQQAIRKEHQEIKEGEKKIEETQFFQDIMPFNPIKSLVTPPDVQTNIEETLALLRADIPEIKGIDPTKFAHLAGEAAKKMFIDGLNFKF